MNNYKKTTFDNGLRLITAPLDSSETATIIVMFATGSRYETPEINGMSHFLEHMFFKGTESRPTSLDITKELDGVGAEYNAFTSKDHTAYYVKVAHQHLPLAIDVVSDMLLNSKFDAEELEKEKGVIVEEINMYEDNPLMYISDIFEEEMYKGSKLGWLIAGSRETVRATTREAMVNYKETHYRGDNTVVCVAGKLPEDIEEQIKKAFSSLKGEVKKNGFGYEPITIDQSEPRVRLMHRKAEQAQIGLGFPAYADSHPDIEASKVLATILGGNMSSRLFLEVREKHGLAYMVRAGVTDYQDTGNFMVRAGLDKNRIKEAIKVIREELEKIKTDGASEDELKRSKDYLVGANSISLENTSTVATWYAEQESLLNHVDTPSERFHKIQAVTADDVKRVANDLFDFTKSTLAIIGPYEDSGEFLDLLK